MIHKLALLQMLNKIIPRTTFGTRYEGTTLDTRIILQNLDQPYHHNFAGRFD
jgi:hypothetical protein